MTDVIGTDIPEITFDTEATASFLGVIVADEVKVGQSQKGEIYKQWHLAVRPVDYRIGGKTGSWHTYPFVDTTRSSPMMVILEALKTTFGSRDENGNLREIMKGQLVGLVGHFDRRDLTHPWKKKAFESALIAVAPATEEETERAQNLPEYVPGAAPTGEIAPTNGHTTMTPEEAALLTSLYEGRSALEAAREALSNTDYVEVRGLVTSQSGITNLVDAGVLAEIDGRFAVVA